MRIESQIKKISICNDNNCISLEEKNYIITNSIIISFLIGTNIELNLTDQEKKLLENIELSNISSIKHFFRNCLIRGCNLESKILRIYPKYEDIDYTNIINIGENFIKDWEKYSIYNLISIIPIVSFGLSKRTNILIKGITDTELQISSYYLENVYLPILKKIRIDASIGVKRGLISEDNGVLNISINPIKMINSFNIKKFGTISSINIVIEYSGIFDNNLLNNIGKNCLKNIKNYTNIKNISYEIKPIIVSSKTNYLNVNIILKSLNGCILGTTYSTTNIKIDVNNFSTDACSKMIDYLSMKNNFPCVDELMCTNLLLYMALSSGLSTIRTCNISNGTKQIINIISELTGAKFEINLPDIKNMNLFDISCYGIGFENPI